MNSESACDWSSQELYNTCAKHKLDETDHQLQQENDNGLKKITQVQKEQPKSEIPWTRYMIMYHRNELCASFALFFTILSAIFSGQTIAKKALQTRHAPKPAPFFPADSVVLDLFDGNKFDFNSFFNHSEVCVIFYYAPWSSASIQFKWHFEQLAKHYSPRGQVRFIAVNCWDPGGLCRHTYRMYTFPVLGVHISPYNRHIYYHGPLLADYVHRFIEEALSPLERLSTVSDVNDFISTCDVCVLGYFNFSEKPLPWGYMNYLQTAFKALERDPLRDSIKFGIMTSKSIATQFTYSSQLRLFNVGWKCWNATNCASISSLDYPYNNKFLSEDILDWVHSAWEREVHRSNWVHSVPLGAAVLVKNEQLMQIISQKPTLILLNARQPLFESYGYEEGFSVLKQVVAEYMKCAGESMDEELFLRRVKDIQERRAWRKANVSRLINLCKDWVGKQKQLKACCSEVVLSTWNVAPHHNICDVCPPTQTRGWSNEGDVTAGALWQSATKYYTNFRSTDMSNIAFTQAVKGVSCGGLGGEIPAPLIVDYCCKPTKPEHLNKNKDGKCNDKGPTHLPDSCNKLRLAKILDYKMQFLEDSNDSDVPSHSFITGLFCATNKSLNFVRIDSSQYTWFAYKLGVPADKPSIIILDNKTESRYVLSPANGSSFSLNQVRTFLWNYTYGLLVNDRVTYSHRPTMHTIQTDSYHVKLWKVIDFEEEVLNAGKDVVLLYSSPSCAACKSVYHIMHLAAFYFTTVQDSIKFAIMDADAVELPWKYSVHRVPAVIIYRSRESSPYPPDLPLTLPNLISFLMASVSPSVRYRLSLDVCVQRQPHNCLKTNKLAVFKRIYSIRTEIRRLRRFIYNIGHNSNFANTYNVILIAHSLDSIERLQMQRKALRHLLRLIESLRVSKDAVDSVFGRGWSVLESEILEAVIKLSGASADRDMSSNLINQVPLIST